MTSHRRGLLAIIAAAALWGGLGLYYRELSHVPALEVLAHRILWSFVFFALMLAARGELGGLRPAFRRPVAGRVLAASALVSVNWLIYIHAIQTGQVLEASFGYYILPLVAVILGVMVFGERLNRLQWGAVALAATGMLVLGVALGVTPWISVTLAVSFGLYAMIKKAISLPPTVSVAAEVAIVAPIALVWLLWPGGGSAIPDPQHGAHFTSDLRTAILLVGTGPLTAAPLILFSYGSQRLPLSTVGLVSYVNPTMQFLVALLVFHQPFTRWHALAFGLIWSALFVFARGRGPAADSPAGA